MQFVLQYIDDPNPARRHSFKTGNTAHFEFASNSMVIVNLADEIRYLDDLDGKTFSVSFADAGLGATPGHWKHEVALFIKGRRYGWPLDSNFAATIPLKAKL